MQETLFSLDSFPEHDIQMLYYEFSRRNHMKRTRIYLQPYEHLMTATSFAFLIFLVFICDGGLRLCDFEEGVAYKN